MSKLFIRPSQVVERLRDRFDYIRAKHPTFPDCKIIAATDTNLAEYLADSDATQPSSTTLYIGGGLSVGELLTSAGPAEANITTGITILLAIGTADEHSKIADEIAVLFKEAVVVSLHGWQWSDNRTPLYFVNDAIVKVKGNAVLLRSYEFAHEVLVSYTDIDDSFDLFDSLDDFLQNLNHNLFNTAPSGDIAEITTNVFTAPLPILDLFPGAVGAYSAARLLATMYNGSAIRVRRDSDNAEVDIGFVDGELDTSSLSTFCAGANGFVATIYDQSGNAEDYTQAVAGNQAKIFDSITGVIIENSKPAMLFDGVNSVYNRASRFGFSVNPKMGVVSVFKDDGETGLLASLFHVGLRNGSGILRAGFGQPGYQWSHNNGSKAFNSQDFSQNICIWSRQENTTYGDSRFFFNGVEKSATQESNPTVSPSDNTQESAIGQGFTVSKKSKMLLSELIIFPDDLSNTNQSIAKELNKYYTVY